MLDNFIEISSLLNDPCNLSSMIIIAAIKSAKAMPSLERKRAIGAGVAKRSRLQIVNEMTANAAPTVLPIPAKNAEDPGE